MGGVAVEGGGGRGVVPVRTVDAAIHPKLLGDVVALCGAPSDPDHGGARDLAELCRDGSDCARGTRDDERVSGLELTDFDSDPSSVALKTASSGEK